MLASHKKIIAYYLIFFLIAFISSSQFYKTQKLQHNIELSIDIFENQDLIFFRKNFNTDFLTKNSFFLIDYSKLYFENSMFNKFNDIFEKNNLAFKKYKVKFSDNNTNDTKVSKHNIKFQFFIIENDKNNNIKIDEIINKYSQKISSDLRNFSLYELNNLERKLDENYFWKKNIFDNEIKEKKYSNAIDRIENKFLMQEFDNKIDFAINLKYIELQKKFLIESDYNFFFNKSIKKNKDTIIIKSIILFISIILLSFILRKFISLKKKLFEII